MVQGASTTRRACGLRRASMSFNADAAFSSALSRGCERLRVGDSLSPETEVGPLIKPREVDRVGSPWVNDAPILSEGSGGRQAPVGNDDGADGIVRAGPDARGVARRSVRPRDLRLQLNRIDARHRTGKFAAGAFQARFLPKISTTSSVRRRSPSSPRWDQCPHCFRTDWMPLPPSPSGYGVGGIPFSMREMTHEKCASFVTPPRCKGFTRGLQARPNAV